VWDDGASDLKTTMMTIDPNELLGKTFLEEIEKYDSVIYQELCLPSFTTKNNRMHSVH
jgi:hypothetical protein